MVNKNCSPFTVAKSISDFLEDIFQVDNITDKICSLESNQDNFNEYAQRNIDFGEALGVASIVIGLIPVVQQMIQFGKQRQIPKEIVIERLILKLGEETSLSQDIREKLITKLIDKLWS